jgi:hypothetical protein
VKEGGVTSTADFATRQCDALTVARSLEKGVSAMWLSDSNADISANLRHSHTLKNFRKAGCYAPRNGSVT